MKEYAYYPGCSVKGTAKQYEESLLATFGALGLTLTELEDWNCCGSTLTLGVDELKSFTMVARNLALAEKTGLDVVTPCSACYLLFLKTQDYIRRYPDIKAKIDRALKSVGMEYRETVKVRHVLDVVVNDVELDEIKERVTRPLRGFKVAPYYGCQIVRPYCEFDDERNPDSMDKLIKGLGAEVVNYPLKTQCCGSSIAGTMEDMGVRINYLLLNEAWKRGANCVVTVCPLCQLNLEQYQGKINKRFNTNISLPILYFTQLLGLAIGISGDRLGFNRSIVPVDSLLATAKVEAA